MKVWCSSCGLNGFKHTLLYLPLNSNIEHRHNLWVTIWKRGRISISSQIGKRRPEFWSITKLVVSYFFSPSGIPKLELNSSIIKSPGVKTVIQRKVQEKPSNSGSLGRKITFKSQENGKSPFYCLYALLFYALRKWWQPGKGSV